VCCIDTMRDRTGRRAAFTLIELLIVMAVLAALATISWPAVHRVLGRGELQRAADMVRQAASDARLAAIESGYVWSLRYEEGGRKIEIRRQVCDIVRAPANSIDDLATHASDLQAPPTKPEKQETSDLADDADSNSAVAVQEPKVELFRLPAGVTFSKDEPRPVESEEPDEQLTDVRDEAVTTPRGEQLPEDLQQPAEPAVRWSKPVLFRPTGKSDDLRLWVVGNNGFCIEVNLVGLTGAVRVGERYRPTAENQVAEPRSTIPSAPAPPAISPTAP